MNEKLEKVCDLLEDCYFALSMDDYGGDRHELALKCGELRWEIIQDMKERHDDND